LLERSFFHCIDEVDGWAFMLLTAVSRHRPCIGFLGGRAHRWIRRRSSFMSTFSGYARRYPRPRTLGSRAGYGSGGTCCGIETSKGRRCLFACWARCPVGRSVGTMPPWRLRQTTEHGRERRKCILCSWNPLLISWCACGLSSTVLERVLGAFMLANGQAEAFPVPLFFFARRGAGGEPTCTVPVL
jgi:hypothetical protein